MVNLRAPIPRCHIQPSGSTIEGEVCQDDRSEPNREDDVAPIDGRGPSEWYWERPDPMVSGTSGDLAKLFRNEGVKHPGVLARDAPSATATVMAREVIQNSWDAANDLRSQLAEIGLAAPDFRIEFRYRAVESDEKARLVKQLDLAGLRAHVHATDRRSLGLSDADCLDHLDGTEPLKVLEVRESGASGMYGPFEHASSKLYLALISLGYTVKHHGAGGSFGFGKAGLIRASRIRSLIAYTCFRERDDDKGVTRRLLGMTYWGQHSLAGVAFNGFARYGEEVGGGRVPFVDEAADSIAESIGLACRDANDVSQLGSSFLLLDPSIEPEELTRAISRNWWPALKDREFVVKVVTADGEELVPRPRSDKVLATFIRGYELALTPQDNSVATEFAKKLGRANPKPGVTLPTGSVGLIADLTAWSYPNEVVDEADDPDLAHRSLVALVRGPRMVVEYLEVGTHPPFVRGTFVADDEVDDLLRQSEPMAHDCWQTNVAEEGVDPMAPKVASSVERNIRDAVKDFRRRLRPPLPKEEDIRLPMLQDLFRRMIAGTGRVPPPPPPRDERLLSIGIDQHVEPASDGLVQLCAKVRLCLSENFDGDAADVGITLKYQFVEDGRSGQSCAIRTQPPDGFNETSAGTFRGTLGRHDVEFDICSVPYSSEWTGRLHVDGQILLVQAAEPS